MGWIRFSYYPQIQKKPGHNNHFGKWQSCPGIKLSRCLQNQED